MSANPMPVPSLAEGLTDESLTIAQHIWGRGNIAPLDCLFGSQAVMSLLPSKGFGFRGVHLGSRLLKYAEDMQAYVDAAEREGALTRTYAKSGSRIHSFSPWSMDAMFKPGRYGAFIILQSSALSIRPENLYKEGAECIKPGGKLFIADLMEIDDDPGFGMKMRGLAASQGWRFHSFKVHVQGVQEAGLKIEQVHDLSAPLLAAIRCGFQKSLYLLAQFRNGEAECRAKRLARYWEQVEAWGVIYTLIETAKLSARGITAVKR